MDALPSVSLPLVWTQSIWPLLIALIVWLAAAGTGMGLLRLAATSQAALTGFELALAPALGFAVLGYLADLLFMTGGLDMRPVYVALTLMGCGLFAWQARRLPAFAGGVVPRPDQALWIVGWLVVAWFAWKLFVGNVTPVNDNDSLFHYAFYSRLLSSGATFDEILLLRNFPVTDLNRIIQHVYALGGTLGGDGALHMVNLLFIGSIALLAQGVSAGLMQVSHWANPLPVLSVITLRELIYTGFGAKLDYGVALFELAAALIFLTWRDRRLWMLAAGLGLALCARSNSLRFAGVIPLLWLVDQAANWRQDGGVRPIVLRTLGVGLGTILVAAPTYAMQQFIYGNPFFPMLNGTFGAYRHYYDWVMFDTLRYRTDYGVLGAPVVYATVALKNIFVVPGVVTPTNSPFGLSALMLLAPIAVRRDRISVWLAGFVGLGYITWYMQANTHRSLLSVAVAAVLLAVVGIVRLRLRAPALHFALFAGVMALASWTAYDFLGFNSLQMNYHYVEGRWTADQYHDLMIRRLYPGQIPDAAEVEAIGAIVGNDHMASIDLAPFAHPVLVKTRRLMLPAKGVTLAVIAADERADPMDRRIAQELHDSTFIAGQASQLSERLWPSDHAQRPLSGSADRRWYLTASHDAARYIGDRIASDPDLLAPMLAFEGVKFVLALRADPWGTRPIAGLAQVWGTDRFVLLRVDEGLSRKPAASTVPSSGHD